MQLGGRGSTLVLMNSPLAQKMFQEKLEDFELANFSAKIGRVVMSV